MPKTPSQKSDSIRRARVNLQALSANLQPGYVDTTDSETFDRALDQLQQSGVDVSEWRISPKDFYEGIEDTALKAKIDAVLGYLAIEQNQTRIGFHK